MSNKKFDKFNNEVLFLYKHLRWSLLSFKKEDGITRLLYEDNNYTYNHNHAYTGNDYLVFYVDKKNCKPVRADFDKLKKLALQKINFINNVNTSVNLLCTKFDEEEYYGNMLTTSNYIDKLHLYAHVEDSLEQTNLHLSYSHYSRNGDEVVYCNLKELVVSYISFF